MRYPARVALTSATSLPVPLDPPPREGVLRYLGIEGCVRLPLRVDAARLAAEIERLPASLWLRGGTSPVVLAAVESLYAIGYQSATRPCPPDDRPALVQLPYLRAVLREQIPAAPVRARIARQRPRALIPIHTDQLRDFRATIRLSIQVAADGLQKFFANGLWYEMCAGEVWVIDNLRPHGINNSGTGQRTTVIADYLPSHELVSLIRAGDHGLGRRDEAAENELESLTRARARELRWEYVKFGFVKLWRRYVKPPRPT